MMSGMRKKMPSLAPLHKKAAFASLTLVGSAVIVTILFAVQGMVRRLNFDEWLVLRSAWLIFNQEASNLHFLMPWTWLNGQLIQNTQDVTTPIRLSRTIVVTLTLFTLWTALRSNQQNNASALRAYVLTLSCGAFVAHAVEIRYDAVIICAWLSAWGLSTELTEKRLVAIGALIAILTLHHIKGLFFATTLTVYIMALTKNNAGKAWKALFIGTTIPILAWLAILSKKGLLQEQMSIYLQFAKISTETQTTSVWAALWPRIQIDIFWWIIVVATSVRTIVINRKNPTVRHTFFFATVPIFFILLHPRPWDYMLTPVIPMLASLSSTYLGEQKGIGLSSMKSLRFRHVALILTTALGLLTHIHALRAKGEGDLKTLHLIASIKNDHDSVLDPVGAIYFIKPASPDWYLDGLFRSQLANKQWNPAGQSTDIDATIIVESYRLRWLTQDKQKQIFQKYENICQWIWLKKNDPRKTTLRNQCPDNESKSLKNYWGTQI